MKYSLNVESRSAHCPCHKVKIECSLLWSNLRAKTLLKSDSMLPPEWTQQRGSHLLVSQPSLLWLDNSCEFWWGSACIIQGSPTLRYTRAVQHAPRICWVRSQTTFQVHQMTPSILFCDNVRQPYTSEGKDDDGLKMLDKWDSGTRLFTRSLCYNFEVQISPAAGMTVMVARYQFKNAFNQCRHIHLKQCDKEVTQQSNRCFRLALCASKQTKKEERHRQWKKNVLHAFMEGVKYKTD